VLANMGPGEIEACTRLGHALERMSADDSLSENDPPQLTFSVI
jgi:hypothetical protein